MTIGLGIFCFISGYLISYNNPEFLSFEDIKKFYKKRIIRIYPLYWLAIVSLIVFLFVSVNILNLQNLSIELNTMMTPFTILISFFGLQILLNPSSVFWYVGFIVLCYALYPLIKKLTKSDVQILLVSLLMIGLFGLLRIFFNLIDDRFFIFFLLFIGGVIVNNEKILENTFSKNKELLLVILSCILVFIFLVDKLYLKNIIPLNLSIIIGYILLNLLIIFFCIFCINLLRKKALNEIITRFGYIIVFIATGSYSVYLFHEMILELGHILSIMVGLTPVANELFILFLIVPIIFVICYYIQIFGVRMTERIIKRYRGI